MKKEVFIQRVTSEIQKRNLSLFLGAGVSAGSGFPDWKTLMKDIVEELELDIDKEDDMISIAQYYKNRKRSRNRLNEKIMNEFGKRTEPSELLSLLCQLPINSIWTTNYDVLIDNEFEKSNKILDIKRTQKDLSISKLNRSAVLYKIHGDINQPELAVITRDDYEDYDRTHGLFIANLIGELASKTFVFIGYSFSDPNFNQILSKVRIHLMHDKHEHFYIVKKATGDYEKIKQELRIEDLKEYGIHTLEIDDYSELTDIFKEIRNQVFKKNVFISGSAHEYSDYGSDDDAKKLIKRIAKELIKNDYRVVNGHGVGVGEHVVQGIIEGLADKNTVPADPYEIKVFPQKISKEQTKKEMWTALREYLISQCRIGIFLFGNKIVNDEVLLANGMKEEFEIAKKHELIIIPVPSTGYQSKELYENNKDYCKITNKLLNNNIDEIVEDLLSLIKGI